MPITLFLASRNDILLVGWSTEFYQAVQAARHAIWLHDGEGG